MRDIEIWKPRASIRTSKEILTRIGRESVPLLQIIGVVVFQALLFVNFTHAIEAIFCDDS
uniref:Uncharacterized protein n=1 Tax=Meloidogyne incognita TaxID=6306 RepID=A0A914M7H5_MELIC